MHNKCFHNDANLDIKQTSISPNLIDMNCLLYEWVEYHYIAYCQQYCRDSKTYCLDFIKFFS